MHLIRSRNSSVRYVRRVVAMGCPITMIPTGTIPESLGQLGSLRNMVLCSNQLSGEWLVRMWSVRYPASVAVRAAELTWKENDLVVDVYVLAMPLLRNVGRVAKYRQARAESRSG